MAALNLTLGSIAPPACPPPSGRIRLVFHSMFTQSQISLDFANSVNWVGIIPFNRLINPSASDWLFLYLRVGRIDSTWTGPKKQTRSAELGSDSSGISDQLRGRTIEAHSPLSVFKYDGNPILNWDLNTKFNTLINSIYKWGRGRHWGAIHPPNSSATFYDQIERWRRWRAGQWHESRINASKRPNKESSQRILRGVPSYHSRKMKVGSMKNPSTSLFKQNSGAAFRINKQFKQIQQKPPPPLSLLNNISNDLNQSRGDRENIGQVGTHRNQRNWGEIPRKMSHGRIEAAKRPAWADKQFRRIQKCGK